MTAYTRASLGAELPATQVHAGAAKGKRRRASSGSASSVVAGTANQSGEVGASAASRLTATSSALSSAVITIRASNAYRRASDLTP